MEFSRPKYWTGFSFPSPWDLPNPGIELRSFALQVDSIQAEPQGKLMILNFRYSFKLIKKIIREVFFSFNFNTEVEPYAN